LLGRSGQIGDGSAAAADVPAISIAAAIDIVRPRIARDLRRLGRRVE